MYQVRRVNWFIHLLPEGEKEAPFFHVTGVLARQNHQTIGFTRVVKERGGACRSGGRENSNYEGWAAQGITHFSWSFVSLSEDAGCGCSSGWTNSDWFHIVMEGKQRGFADLLHNYPPLGFILPSRQGRLEKGG